MARGISKSDWDLVQCMAVSIVNAEEGVEHYKLVSEFNDLLDELDQKYGENEELIATRADFEENLEKKERLLLRALSVARDYGNSLSEMLTLSSLAEIYGEYITNPKLLQIYLTEFRDALNRSPDEEEEKNYQEWFSSLQAMASGENLTHGKTK